MTPEAWGALLEHWHDFFVLSGTAAVTLVGLLFVAISLHVEALVEEGREHLLELARVTMLSFIVVLVVALALLIPHVSQRVVGVQLIVLGGMFVLVSVRALFFSKGRAHEHYSLARFRRRMILPLVGYVLLVVVGWRIRSGTDPDALNYIFGPIVLLLGNAIGTSWELLVRVARMRRSDRAHAA